jgi:hypothetical protein
LRTDGPRKTPTRSASMAVMSLRSLVAVSALLPAVSAGLGREQPIPPGAVQTPAPNLKDAGAFQLLPRVLTAAPAPRGILQKRDTNTCGYVDGNPSELMSPSLHPARASAPDNLQGPDTSVLRLMPNASTTRKPPLWAAV